MSQLTKTVEIYKSIENPIWDGARVSGAIKVSELLVSFVDEYGDDCAIELVDDGLVIDKSDLNKYEKIQIKFSPPRKEFSFFAKNFDDYLSYFSFTFKKADEFYISDIDGIFNKNGTSNEIINTYLKILEIYKLLLRIADHTEKDDANCHKHIILSVSGKDEIPVTYNGEDVARFSECLQDIQINSIEEELFSSPHEDVKKSLFKKSISKFLTTSPDAEKFTHLVKYLPNLVKTYKNDYELFLNEFSFEDEKEKLEKSKQEYILKLNEILSGIHSKLLAVPVSLVIVVGQMKAATEDNYFIGNLFILIGSIIFSILMWMLSRNQLHSLQAVKTEYTAKKVRLKSMLRHSLYKELREAFVQLDARFQHQTKMICVVNGLVLFGLISAIFVFGHHTSYFQNFFS